jgi:cytoskeletal protein CcmA (bactofilin family)
MLKRIFRGIMLLMTVILLTAMVAMPALAAEMRSGDTITVASGDVVDDDLYIGGSNIVIDGIVNGDIFAMGMSITINGTVNGSVSLAAQSITINGDITGSARIAGSDINIRGTIGRDLLAAGANVNIASGAKIGRDLLFGATNVSVNGPVGGDIKGGGATVTLASQVAGNAEIEADRLILSSAAIIQGDLAYTSQNEADIQSGAQILGTTNRNLPAADKQSGPFSDIGGKILAFLMTLLVGIVLILIFPRRVVAVSSAIRHKPWLSLGWGALIFCAVPIAALIMLITVIGIPLSLITLVIYVIAIYLTQIVVGLFIGRWILGRFSKVESRGMLIGSLALGFFILTVLKLIPIVGVIVWFATVFFGLGAMLLSNKFMHHHEPVAPVITPSSEHIA